METKKAKAEKIRKQKNSIEKKIEKGIKEKLIQMLKRQKVSNVKLDLKKKKISLCFIGQRICDNVLVEWEPHVGEWSRKRKEVIIDSDILKNHKKKSFKSLCVHEAVEKFVAQKFHLKTDDEAHPIAYAVEKKYLKSIGGNWKSHEKIVYWDWHKHGEY